MFIFKYKNIFSFCLILFFLLKTQARLTELFSPGSDTAQPVGCSRRHQTSRVSDGAHKSHKVLRVVLCACDSAGR